MHTYILIKNLLRESYFLERGKGIGIIGRGETLNWVLSGSMLRVFGIKWDECYDKFD